MNSPPVLLQGRPFNVPHPTDESVPPAFDHFLKYRGRQRHLIQHHCSAAVTNGVVLKPIEEQKQTPFPNSQEIRFAECCALHTKDKRNSRATGWSHGIHIVFPRSVGRPPPPQLPPPSFLQPMYYAQFCAPHTPLYQNTSGYACFAVRHILHHSTQLMKLYIV